MNGRVTDQRANPVAGAAVTVAGPGPASSATTDNDGRFTLSLPPGVYTVTVNRGGFATAQNDVAIVAGSTVTLSVPLQDQNLQSLRVIGRTSTNSQRAQLNISESSVSTLPPLEITLRQNNTLTDTVATMPGVVVQRTFSSTPNTNFVVRGAGPQTRVTVDGHPVSSGIFGQWNTNYAASGIFNDVEVVKGTGLNGAIAGESAVGTVNLRTRDFTAKNSAGIQLGTDNYSGGLYNMFADVNFLNNKASLIVAKSFIGYNGPWQGYFGNRSGANTLATRPVAQGAPQQFIGLDQWQGDYSNRYGLEAELAKFRYRFSETSSVTLEYLGMHGQYQPQGGSYGTYQGKMTLQACQNGAAFQPTLATCGTQSTYTAPYTFGQIGQTVDAYQWFPNSFIQNNEPQFAAEFRTAIKNDTLLFRPYTHLINRYISGVRENNYPGNGGAWFAVTNAANCQVKFIAPGTTGGPAVGAAGPCFPATTGPNGAAYVGNDPTVHQFLTTPNALNCSVAAPCFTTTTGIQNDGTFGFGTPFSQPEVDRLNGYTLSLIHPAGNNIFNFSIDYRKDYAQSQSSDQSGAAPGCQFVIGSVSGANVLQTAGPNKGQPYPGQQNCSTTTFTAPYTRYNILPRSAIGTPPTVSTYTDFALTGTFHLGDKLSLAIGNYLELYKLNAQIEDPNVLLAYAAMGTTNAAPVALVSRNQNYSHYDPHVGLEYRVNRNLSLRANAGSSITQPWPGIVSGFGSITLPNAANGGNYTNSIPNFSLKPETTVSYDLGFDQRIHDGAVVSFDLYDITIHDVFISNTTNLGTFANTCGPGNGGPFPNSLCLQTNQINGPIQRGYGAELSITKNPVNGWGYYVSSTLSRTYLDQLPLSIYFANTTPGNGNFNVNGAQLFGNPFFKTYAQLLYSNSRGAAYEIGADYQGPDNSTFGQPYILWDAAAKIPLHKNVALQISAQNLFNYVPGTALGRSLQLQGNIQPQLYLSNGVLLPTGGTSNINALPPRTFRFSLDFHP
ncbi:MAG: TonB-dependent receptor [Candidatus Eremiobacteraeota bacterium]|nr:TonB-dependent receptor [Candidatus Eremiobacteraeota bacterium]